MIESILLAAACTSPLSGVTCFLGAGSNIWFPIVVLATIAVIAVVAVLYQISPIFGRTDIKVWARAKIYDGIITIIFALIFLSFSTLIIVANPVGALNSIGILPNSCNPAISNNPSSSNIADIYGVASCDMYSFNNDAAGFTEALYILGIIGGINPAAHIDLPVPGYPINIGTGSGLGISFEVVAFPIQIVFQYIVPYTQAYFLAILVSQLLQIVLSSSALLFSIFMILGLIARSFGITKSFGGAMIAFAIGLGFIYPLMASLTYGFIDTAIQNASASVSILSLAPTLLLGFLNLLPGIVFNGSISFAFLTPVFLYGGFIATGILLIPLLNLIVVDAFIVDFSRAIGERMDLFSLLTRMI